MVAARASSCAVHRRTARPAKTSRVSGQSRLLRLLKKSRLMMRLTERTPARPQIEKNPNENPPARSDPQRSPPAPLVCPVLPGHPVASVRRFRPIPCPPFLPCFRVEGGGLPADSILSSSLIPSKNLQNRGRHWPQKDSPCPPLPASLLLQSVAATQNPSPLL